MIKTILKFAVLVFFWLVIAGAMLKACDHEMEHQEQQNRDWAKNGGY